MKTNIFKNSAIIMILSCIIVILFATMNVSADTKITKSNPGAYQAASGGYQIRSYNNSIYTTGSSNGKSWGYVSFKKGSTTYKEKGFVVTKDGTIKVNGSTDTNPYIYIPKRYKINVNGTNQYLDLKITFTSAQNYTGKQKFVALLRDVPTDFFVAKEEGESWNAKGKDEYAKFRLNVKMQVFLNGSTTLAKVTDGNFVMRMDDFDAYQYFGTISSSPAKCYGLKTDKNTTIDDGWYDSNYNVYHKSNHDIAGGNNLYFLYNNSSKNLEVNCYWGFQKQAGSEVYFYGSLNVPTYDLTINKTCNKGIYTHGNANNHFSGTTFALYNSEKEFLEQKTITSGNSVTFSHLPPGKYYYKETQKSYGHYLTSDERETTVTSNTTVTFQNKAQTDPGPTPNPDPPGPTPQPQPPTPQPQPPTPTYTPPTTTLNVKLNIQKSSGASAGKSLSGYKIQLKSSNNTYTKYTDALGNVSFPGLTLNTSHTITCSPPKNNTWSEWGNNESIYNSLEPAGGKVITSNNSESSLSTTYNLLYRSISEEEIAPIDIPDTAIYEIRYIDEEDLKRIENEDVNKRPDWFSDLKEILKQSLQKKTSSEAKARYNKEGKPVN